jgi:hypothetical protein
MSIISFIGGRGVVSGGGDEEGTPPPDIILTFD